MQPILRVVLALPLAGLLSCPLAAGAEQLSAEYEIAWNGIAIGAFETELVTGPERYRFAYEARTIGLVGWLFPFVSEGRSEGELRNARPLPERYQVRSRWDDGSSDYGVDFGPDGRATRVEVPADDLADRDPVPAHLQVGPDPLALALEAFAGAGPGAALSGASFDGKRALRFEVACADTPVALDRGRDGAARAAMPEIAGDPDALLCEVDGRLVAGASRRWRNRDPDRGEREPVKVWLSGALRADHFWPVRVEIETRFGQVSAHLVSRNPTGTTRP